MIRYSLEMIEKLQQMFASSPGDDVFLNHELRRLTDLMEIESGEAVASDRTGTFLTDEQLEE